MGSTFPYVLASGIFRMREKPYLTGGLLIIAGYLQAALRREGRYDDPEFRSQLRRWQRRRLLKLVAGGGTR